MKSGSTVKKVFCIEKTTRKMDSSQNVEPELSTNSESSTPKSSDSEDSCIDFNERRRLLGGKRDDLYFKTVSRDVRKLAQENFQKSVGETSIRELVKNETFYMHFKKYFNQEVFPRLSSEDDHTRIFCCVATLINYKGFQKECPEENKLMSYLVDDGLSRFTKSKLQGLCNMPEFKKVFLMYAEDLTNDGMERFEIHKTMKQNIPGHKLIFETILSQ